MESTLVTQITVHTQIHVTAHPGSLAKIVATAHAVLIYTMYYIKVHVSNKHTQDGTFVGSGIMNFGLKFF